MLVDALLLQLGYNATLVAFGATLLGLAAGISGTFLFLRNRALLSDAISHATLPGVAAAFLVMVALGGDGRSLIGLMAGSAISALIGLFCVNALVRHTRLNEDAAIGAVLSVFFGFGVVLMTIIQTLPGGRQAGLESFLLGSTAAMLWADAVIIAGGGAAVVALSLMFRRPFLLVAFDPGYAVARGLPVARLDLLMMALVMAVTVVGLKIVGLILVVALLIVPPVTARLWSDVAGHVVWLSGGFGASAAYVGAAVSAAAPDLPTGPIIVLVSFGQFAISLLIAPNRGVLAAWLRYRKFQRRIHVRQGLLALAQGHPIYERLTLRLLVAAGWARPDGVATAHGRERAEHALRDEARWMALRSDNRFEATAVMYDGVRDIDTVLTPDQIAEIDRQITGAPA